MSDKRLGKKGTASFPSSFIMTQDTTITAIETLVHQILAHIEAEDVFLVSIKIKPTNNIKVFLDADSGLSIDKCVKINRAMYKVVEEKGWYPDGNFSLEVSSPGIDEPLKLLRQYKKNIGRKVEVTLNDEKKTEGKLLEVTEEGITIETTTGKNKKAIIEQKQFAFSDIKQTKIIIAF
ncbi:ribosome assembly cofactor RimP [Ferruginibacter sp. SUN002]|uniref:ribosome assembly cofactor RimP n=1 Tax=Ferruginibacter sp. SUN002 TaxID=2937789 RepID=UPI003D35B1FC